MPTKSSDLSAALTAALKTASPATRHQLDQVVNRFLDDNPRTRKQLYDHPFSSKMLAAIIVGVNDPQPDADGR